MTAITKRLVAIWCASVMSAAVVVLAGDTGEPRLTYAVIVSRHGVRSPTWTNDRLNRYSVEPWPQWGVPPGYLTPRGRTLMGAMGTYYAAWFKAEGLLSGNGCADASRVYIWADTDQRTVETGRALAERIARGCDVIVHSLRDGETDPIFDPIEAGLVTPDPEVAASAIRDRMGTAPAAFLRAHRAAFDALHHVLSGGGAPRERPFASATEIGVAINGGQVELVGPLSAASTLSEVLLLEYANGLPKRELGWGRLDAETLRRVLELHTAYADLMRRSPYLARARGANLLTHILRSVEQAATGRGVEGALGQPGDALLIISGHDTNLSNISGMLGLSWKLPGYPPDDTPPGGALVFSVWRNAAGAHFVRTQYLAQTPDQMRNAEILTLSRPPAMQDVTIPGCATETGLHQCSLATFSAILERAILPAVR